MRIGQYEVEGEVGRGGMGAVFRARSPDGRAVAIKLLHKLDERALARFERERRLLADLASREGFVPLLDAGSIDEGPWFAMPLVAGGTLRERLRRGPLSVAETVALGRKLALALGRAHAKGIVHRDLKPENILFTEDGTPLVADLGIAKHFDHVAPGASQSVSISEHGGLLGTAGYMAPEQLTDAKSAGPPADVFALGAILHECLAGRPAFKGDGLISLVVAVRAGAVEPLASHRPDAPAWLMEAIRHALAVDPAHRPRDGAAFAATLVPRRGPAHAVARAALVVALGIAGVVAAAAVARVVRPGSTGTGATASVRSVAPPVPHGESDARRRAREALARGRKEFTFRAAIPHGTAAVEADPTFVTAWILRGRWRALAGDFRDGLDDLTRAVALEPANPETWTNRGVTKSENGDHEGARADLDQAIALAPDKAVPLGERGRARERAGDLDGAIADLDRAVAVEPRYTEGFFNRGFVKALKSDRAGAMADFTRVIEADPSHHDAWTQRGNQYLLAADYPNAIEDYSRAIAIQPGRAASFTGRAEAKRRTRDHDGAIADFTKALALEPGNAGCWLGRGRERAIRDDLDGAISDLEQYLLLAPDKPETVPGELKTLRTIRARR